MAVNKIYLVIGARGAGKTPFITGGDFEEGLAAKWLKKGMSVLIIDEIDHEKYKDFPIMHPKDYPKLSTTVGKYRTLSAQQYLPDLVRMIGEKQMVWNTLLVFEDSKKSIPTVFQKPDWAIIGNSKQQNVDLVYMYWNWGIVPPDILRNANYLVIFRTSDGPACRESYINGCYDKALEAHKLVCAGKKINGKPYAVIDTGI